MLGITMNGWRGEGEEGVLPIKADGDGFAQEVRLHLFYCTNQSDGEPFSHAMAMESQTGSSINFKLRFHLNSLILKLNLPCPAKTSLIKNSGQGRLTNEC